MYWNMFTPLTSFRRYETSGRRLITCSQSTLNRTTATSCARFNEADDTITSKMEIDDEKKFYVIRFLDLPYPSINKYVVVPNSWIRLRSSFECKAQVAYPVEDFETTIHRAEREELFNESWIVYNGVIEYESDDYDDAEIWIATMPPNDSTDDQPLVVDVDDLSIAVPSITMESNNVSNGNGSLNAKTTGNQTVSVNGNRPGSSQQNYLLNSNKNKPEMKVGPLNNGRNTSAKLSPKRSLPTDGRTAVAMLCCSSSAQSHQSTESSQRISVVSEDFLRNGPSIQRRVAERSIETHDNKQITPPQGTPKNKSAIQALLCLLDKLSQLNQFIPGSSSSIIENQIRQELGRQETLNKSTRADQISHRPYLQSVSNNTSSALQNSASLENNPRQLTKRSPGKQNQPAHKEMTMQSSRPNEVVIGASKETVIDDKIISPFVNKQARSAVKKSQFSDRVNEIFEDLHEKPLASYKVSIQQDHHANKINITRSNEMECNDRTGAKVPSQSTPKNVLSVDKNFAGKSLSQTSENESDKRFPPASRGNLQHDPQTQGYVVRRTTGKDPMDLMDLLRNKAESTPPAMGYFSNTDNPISQLSKPLNEIPVSKDQCNVQQVQGTQRSLASESTASNRVVQRSGQQGITHNVQSAMHHSLPTAENQSRETAKQSSQKGPQPVVKGLLLQDPRSGIIYIKPVTNVNGSNKKPRAHGTDDNVTIAVAATQPFQEKQCATYYRNYTLPSQPAQQPHLRGLVVTNGTNQRAYSQNIPQNILPAAQNSSNSATDFCCSGQCSQGRRIPPVAQTHSYQDPRIQETLLGGSSVCSGSNTETRQSAAVNPTNITNQLKPTFGNSADKPILPVFLNPSNQQPCQRKTPDFLAEERDPDKQIFIEKIPVEWLIDPNSSGQRVPLENALEDISKDITNSPNAMGSSLGDRITEDQSLLNAYKLLFLKLNSKLDERYEVINNIYKKFVESDEQFKKVIDRVNEHCEIQRDRAFCLSEQAKTINKRNKRRPGENDRYHNHDSVDNDFEDSDYDFDYEPLMKKRSQKPSFT